MENTKKTIPRILVQGEANNFLGEDGVIYFSTNEETFDIGDTAILGNRAGTMKTAVRIFDNFNNYYGGIVESGIIQNRLDLTHIHNKIKE